MSGALAVSFALLLADAPLGESAKDPQFLVNSKAITNAIQQGSNLQKLGLDMILDEAELTELRNLASCTPTFQPEMTKNLVVVDWKCEKKMVEQEKLPVTDRTVKMRFKNEGGLFALAVNPPASIFGPTVLAVTTTSLPSKSEMARRFADAVEKSEDPTLNGLIPLTSLQRHQIARMAGFKAQIMKPPSASEKREAQKHFKFKLNFYEPPKNGFDIEFSATQKTDVKPLALTIYFDDKDRPIGVHVEESLLVVSALPLGGR